MPVPASDDHGGGGGGTPGRALGRDGLRVRDPARGRRGSHGGGDNGVVPRAHRALQDPAHRGVRPAAEDVLGALGAQEIDELFLSACASAPEQFAGIVSPEIVPRYEIVLRHWRLGEARFRFSCTRPRKIAKRIELFRRRCTVSGTVSSLPEGLQEQAARRLVPLQGRLRQRVADFFRRRRHFFVEVSWPIDRRGRPGTGIGRFRYPIGYPQDSHEARTGHGAYFNAPVASDNKRHGPARNEATNAELRAECESLLTDALARHAIPRWGAEGLNPLVPSSDMDSHHKIRFLLSELANQDAMPVLNWRAATELRFKGKKRNAKAIVRKIASRSRYSRSGNTAPGSVFQRPASFRHPWSAPAARSARGSCRTPALQTQEVASPEIHNGQSTAGGTSQDHDQDDGAEADPGEAGPGHSPFEPDPKRNAPEPGPIPSRPGRTPRRSGYRNGAPGSSENHSYSTPTPELEKEHIETLKLEHYASHCQMCLCEKSPRVLAPEGSYIQWEEVRRRVVEAHHVDLKSAGGARHAGNLILLCKLHHDNYGRRLTGPAIVAALRGNTREREIRFGVDSKVKGQKIELVISDTREVAELFFTDDHADFWLSHRRTPD